MISFGFKFGDPQNSSFPINCCTWIMFWKISQKKRRKKTHQLATLFSAELWAILETLLDRVSLQHSTQIFSQDHLHSKRNVSRKAMSCQQVLDFHDKLEHNTLEKNMLFAILHLVRHLSPGCNNWISFLKPLIFLTFLSFSIKNLQQTFNSATLTQSNSDLPLETIVVLNLRWWDDRNMARNTSCQSKHGQTKKNKSRVFPLEKLSMSIGLAWFQWSTIREC